MKYLLSGLICFSLINSYSSFAQPKAIALEYNDFAFIRNANINYSHSLFNKRFSVYGGISYHFNDNLYLAKIVENQYAVFYTMKTNVLKPTTFFPRLGLKIGLEKTIKLPSEHSNAFIFYDFQYCSPDISGGDYGIDRYGNVVAQTPIPSAYAVSPHVYLQHTGIGLRAKVYKNINVKLMAGLGIYKLSIEKGYFAWYGEEISPQSWQFSRMFGVGVEYNLFKEKEAKIKTK